MNKKSYDETKLQLKNMLISKEEFKNTNLYKMIHQNDNELAFFDYLYVSIQSMSNQKNPSHLRIRSDKFLQLAKLKHECLLISSYRNSNGKITHLILSSLWFFNYEKSINSSNSFVTFDFSRLEAFTKYHGLQYKIWRGKVKYIILSVLDDEIDLDEITKVRIEWKFFQNNPDYLIKKDKILESYDPVIKDETKSLLLDKHNFSCALNNFNNNICRTKIDWIKTKKAIENTNLNLPLDFHHFIPRSFFKNKLENNTRSESNSKNYLDWEKIHSKDNVIPLCKLCHQSIHNKDKNLVTDTFNYIIQMKKEQNDYNSFVQYYKSNKYLSNDNELLNFYIEREK